MRKITITILCLSIAVTSIAKDKYLKKAHKLHNKIISLDTHTDTPMRLWDSTYNINMDNPTGCIDFPKMKNGRLDVESFAIFTGEGKRDNDFFDKTYSRALQTLEKINSLPTQFPSEVEIVTTPKQIYKVKANGKLGIIPTIENLTFIGNDINKIKTLRDMGVVMFGLVHSYHNNIADSSTDKKEPEHNGLSNFGKEVIKEINKVGGIVDISHASDKSFFDAVQISSKPIIASHSSVRNIANIDRNFTDQMLNALKDNGGVIQICILERYVRDLPYNEEYNNKYKELYAQLRAIPRERVEERNKVRAQLKELKDEYPDQRTYISHYVDHIDYVVNKIGIDYVGIGTDFDGGGGIYDCYNASQLVGITAELIKRGYSNKDIEKIWGGNFLRVMQECQNI